MIAQINYLFLIVFFFSQLKDIEIDDEEIIDRGVEMILAEKFMASLREKGTFTAHDDSKLEKNLFLNGIICTDDCTEIQIQKMIMNPLFNVTTQLWITSLQLKALNYQST
jgi:5-formaminoimidazole-4-carboxamide-1-beta-D-ribofuranosyl 5'-monophosphate synthetase